MCLNLIDLLHKVCIFNHAPDLDSAWQSRIADACEKRASVLMDDNLGELYHVFRVYLAGLVIVIVDLFITSDG